MSTAMLRRHRKERAGSGDSSVNTRSAEPQREQPKPKKSKKSEGSQGKKE